jgi:transcription elongation factor Elf1
MVNIKKYTPEERKERIRASQKKYAKLTKYNCPFCNIEISRNGKTRHDKSKSHIMKEEIYKLKHQDNNLPC